MTNYDDWCRNLMAMLAEGGAWGVPRSGLTFMKRGRALVLRDRAPEWDADVQDADFAAVKRHFEAAGFEVIDESKA